MTVVVRIGGVVVRGGGILSHFNLQFGRDMCAQTQIDLYIDSIIDVVSIVKTNSVLDNMKIIILINIIIIIN